MSIQTRRTTRAMELPVHHRVATQSVQLRHCTGPAVRQSSQSTVTRGRLSMYQVSAAMLSEKSDTSSPTPEKVRIIEP
ncbi:hypothetical protein KIN20_015623 [Parelaphostrongylus tenuis]|uniref:Uncharacterized protein n=1 Tax=Parelaphostrongylus tenuis TaxID=148309 RepID=A0AAD5MF80_PARTN|nr:hypothetical protein KIN20_015623 [Parelaphostrongylus tenuis]